MISHAGPTQDRDRTSHHASREMQTYPLTILKRSWPARTPARPYDEPLAPIRISNMCTTGDALHDSS